jgi:hypothetical protein
MGLGATLRVFWAKLEKSPVPATRDLINEVFFHFRALRNRSAI